MICFECHRPVRGADVGSRYEWRVDVLGGVPRVYGDSGPDGKLKDATGRLLKLSHNKCYHAWKKRQDLAEAKAADPSAQPTGDTDWRHQEVVDVEDLCEGHGGNRGA